MASTALTRCGSSWSQEFVNVTGPLHLIVVWNQSSELVVGMVPSDSRTITWVCRIFAYLFRGSYWHLRSMLVVDTDSCRAIPFLASSELVIDLQSLSHCARASESAQGIWGLISFGTWMLTFGEDISGNHFILPIHVSLLLLFHCTLLDGTSISFLSYSSC